MEVGPAMQLAGAQSVQSISVVDTSVDPRARYASCAPDRWQVSLTLAKHPEVIDLPQPRSTEPDPLPPAKLHVERVCHTWEEGARARFASVTI